MGYRLQLPVVDNVLWPTGLLPHIRVHSAGSLPSAPAARQPEAGLSASLTSPSPGPRPSVGAAPLHRVPWVGEGRAKREARRRSVRASSAPRLAVTPGSHPAALRLSTGSVQRKTGTPEVPSAVATAMCSLSRPSAGSLSVRPQYRGPLRPDAGTCTPRTWPLRGQLSLIAQPCGEEPSARLVPSRLPFPGHSAGVLGLQTSVSLGPFLPSSMLPESPSVSPRRPESRVCQRAGLGPPPVGTRIRAPSAGPLLGHRQAGRRHHSRALCA